MSALLILDFETYFDTEYTLASLTIPEYVHDPRFHVHGLAIREPDGTCRFETDVPSAFHNLQARYGRALERCTVVCHNAAFDGYVLAHRYGIVPTYLIDTLLLAHHVHGRKDKGRGASASLKELALRYGLEPKGDVSFLRGIRFPTAPQLDALRAYAIHDVELTHAVALNLLPQISRPGVELRLMRHTLDLFIQRSVRVDVDAIPAMIAEHERAVQAHLLALGATETDLSSPKRFGALLTTALAKTDRTIPLKQGTRGLIPAIAKDDEPMLALREDPDPAVRALVQARLEKTSRSTQRARLETLRGIVQATGGVLPVTLQYYGAHTGRFSGGGRFNIQNLGRDGTGADIRRLLIARPGHRFVIADWSQIEARILAVLADDKALLAAFAAGRDVYSEYASRCFGREVRKPRPEDAPDVAGELKAMRHVGKTAVLALGFGEGAARFDAHLRCQPLIAPLFASGMLSLERCAEIVYGFRDDHPGYPQLWWELEEAFRGAMDGAPREIGFLRLERRGTAVVVTLPSSREIRYENPSLVVANERSFVNREGETSTFTPDLPSIQVGNASLYGSKLCENVVQAIARDLLADTILALEAEGCPVAFHIHDEVVLEAQEEAVDETRRILHRIMTSPPPWLPGIPLACEMVDVPTFSKEAVSRPPLAIAG